MQLLCTGFPRSRICAWEFQILDRKNGNKKNGQMLYPYFTKKKRTLQIFRYELLIQNNNLSITNKYKLYVHTYKLNKTSARIIDNCFFFRANTTRGKMCEHHFFCAILASNVRMFAHFVRIWEPLVLNRK